MVRSIILAFLIVSSSCGNIYETNCVACHKKLPVEIDKFFYRYLLKYSSERQVKKFLVEYLQNPSKQRSVMPESFIARFGIKKETALSEKELKEAVDIYWGKYKVFGKLK